MFHIGCHYFVLSVLNIVSKSVKSHLCLNCHYYFFMQSYWVHLCSAYNVENTSFIIIQFISLIELLGFIIECHYMVPCVYHVQSHHQGILHNTLFCLDCKVNLFMHTAIIIQLFYDKPYATKFNSDPNSVGGTISFG